MRLFTKVHINKGKIYRFGYALFAFTPVVSISFIACWGL